MMEAAMLCSEVTGQRPRARPRREQEWKESEDREPLLDDRERMHAFDEMLHWQDPEQRLHTLRRRRRTLIDDNPASG
jgi:hypothetical protein